MLAVAAMFIASAAAEPSVPEAYAKLKKDAAARKRRIVFHSDGISMDRDKRFLEPNECVLPYLPGTDVDACTYSLIHQFPVVRLYRSKAGQEWPPGDIQKRYGDGPDGLDRYIDFCHKNGYEAFWAMRTNDTHDSGRGDHGRRRWNSNKWKQAHPELLVGSKDKRPPLAGWTALDYAQQGVRDKVFSVADEVCRNYAVDGLTFDFFRHLPTFKSTAQGKDASDEDRAMITELFRKLRKAADRHGMRRGRPILLAVRTPDSPEYCKALGLDVERWMKEGLIDIWITTGYFRLQEWEKAVEIGHGYGVQVWASLDESRVVGRRGRNSVEEYRGRAMNAWTAGVDAIFLFNFFYLPDSPQFKLLNELDDPATLARLDKTYVADARGQRGAAKADIWLKGGGRFFTRPKVFSPGDPTALIAGKPLIVNVRVGDDVGSAKAEGFSPEVTLSIQLDKNSGRDDLRVSFNNRLLKNPTREDDLVNFKLAPSLVKQGANQVEIARAGNDQANILVHDLQLEIRYKPETRPAKSP